MKIAIFENQFHQVKTQFEVANKLFFNNQLEYLQFNSSQDLSPLNKIINFDLVIVDISLAANSNLDGFDLIKNILLISGHPKILILTGNSNIKENLNNRNLPSLPILMKPVDVVDISEKIKKVMNLQ